MNKTIFFLVASIVVFQGCSDQQKIEDGEFLVWTKRVGNNPGMKVLLSFLSRWKPPFTI